MDISDQRQIVEKYLKSKGVTDAKQRIEDLKLKALEPDFTTGI